jgi:predicted 3-demethylubiquinone-9 3-methyltransferase (glyoxalase superfamily)
METIEIKNSSAIAKIVFNDEKNIVGICFTSNIEKSYDFYCETFEDTKTKIIETDTLGESVGKLIHSFRKDGTLEAIVDE